MHWDDLKDDDLICVISEDGSYAVNKKEDLFKDEIKNKSCFNVKRKDIEISIDEMRDTFIKKVCEIFQSNNLLLKKMDADDKEISEADNGMIEHIIKKSLVIDGFVHLKHVFNAIALDLNFYEKIDKIYFDKTEPIGDKMADGITFNFNIIGIRHGKE